MIRIPDPGRFELRLMDGSANPYLLQASILAAGLDGLKNKIDPGKPLDCNMYEDYKKYPDLPKLPDELDQSLEKLKNNKDNLDKKLLPNIPIILIKARLPQVKISR